MFVCYDCEFFVKIFKVMECISEIKVCCERIFYKKCMVGKRVCEVVVVRKLVVDNEYLFFRFRGSEKRRLVELVVERGVDVEELEREEFVVKVFGKKSKVFGGEVKRLRVRIDGGVEEIIEFFGGVVGEDDDEDDGFEDEDDEMDID